MIRLKVKGMKETVQAFNRLSQFESADVGVWTVDPQSTLKLLTLNQHGYNFWHRKTLMPFVDQLAKLHLDWIGKSFIRRVAQRAVRPLAARIGRKAAKSLRKAIRDGVLGQKKTHGPETSNSFHQWIRWKSGGGINPIGVLTGDLTASLRGGVLED